MESPAPDDLELPLPPLRTPMVVWIHDGPVCVTVVDQIACALPRHCQCQACRTTQHADWAVHFL
jgi:hypothetical protein